MDNDASKWQTAGDKQHIEHSAPFRQSLAEGLGEAPHGASNWGAGTLLAPRVRFLAYTLLASCIARTDTDGDKVQPGDKQHRCVTVKAWVLA